MKYRKHPYTFRFAEKRKVCRIYASFFDGQRHLREVEVSEEVYWELVALNRSLQNMEKRRQRENKRCLLDDGVSVGSRSRLFPPAEDEALKRLSNEQLRLSFQKIPPFQARRFLLVFGLDFSHAKTASIEGCSIEEVKHSIAAARRSLRRALGDRMP